MFRMLVGLMILIGFGLGIVGAQTDGEPVAFDQRFVTLNGNTSHPPDVALAVGPTHIVTGTNTVFSLSTKIGIILQSEQTDIFFGQKDMRYVGDPRCVYDPGAQRFFCMSFYVNLDDLPTAFLLAVSRTSEPESLGKTDWQVFEVRLPDQPGVDSATVELRADFNSIAVTTNHVVMTTNMNKLRERGNGHGRVVVLNKRALLENGEVVRDAEEAILLDGRFAALQPVVTPGESETVYLVHMGGSPSQCTISLFWFDESLEFHRWDVVGNFGCAETGRVAPQAGTELPIYYEARNRTRPLLRDGKLYLVAGTPAAGSGDGPTGLRWLVIDLANGPSKARIEQTGYVKATDTWYYFAEITANQAGDIAVFFTASSQTITPSFCYVTRLAVDPANTMRPVQCPIASQVPQTTAGFVDETDFARFGDYCGTAIDPVDDSLWGACEVLQRDGAWNIWAMQVFAP